MGHRNSFGFARFAAAISVVISHHFALSGLPEPYVPVFGDLGKLAVCVFFVMSGFLITQSLERSNGWADFFSARLLRLMPNLLFAVSSTSLVLMVLYRNYQPDHVVSHIGYVARNAVMFVHGVDYDIKGIFEEMRSSAINGPLWSLPYEFWLYVALFILFTAGVFWLRIVGVMLAFVACLAISFLTATDLPVLPLSTDQLGRLGSFFFAGAIVAFAWPYILWRKSFVVFATIALLAATTFLPLTVSEVAMPFAFALIALCVSPLMAWFALAGDASYGIYVFGWPVQQLAIKSVGSFWVSLAVSLVVSTCVGYATWHLFEKRCTKQRSRLSRFLSSIRTTAPARDEPSHIL